MILALAPPYPTFPQVGLRRSRGLGASGGAVAISIGTSTAQGLIAGGPIGAAVAAVTAGISALINRAGPKQDVATTNIVNQIEPYMQQNLDAWNSSSKNCSEYVQCIANWQQLWNTLVNGCLTPGMGSPGHSCVNDRIPSGVTFSYNTFNIQGDGRFPWDQYYLDPIMNDPAAAGICCLQPPTVGIPGAPCYDPFCNAPVTVPACTNPASSGGSTAATTTTAATVGGIPLSWLLIAGFLAVGLWVMS